MFIVTRIWISISDLDLNSIIESHNENLKNLLNFIIIIKMANGMGSFAFFGFISRPWHFWAHINYHCDPFDTRTPNLYFLGWFSDLFFWPKKRCAFCLRIIWREAKFWDKDISRKEQEKSVGLTFELEFFHGSPWRSGKFGKCLSQLFAGAPPTPYSSRLIDSLNEHAEAEAENNPAAGADEPFGGL